MKETIYTIPVTEAFEKRDGCPICSLYHMLEEREIDSITGASMMEPDVRLETNRQGFCPEHYHMMEAQNAKLPLGLMLQSHLDEIHKKLAAAQPAKGKPEKPMECAAGVNRSCYVCGRINGFMEKICGTVCYLWKKEPEFRELLREQPYFCMPHFELLLRTAGGAFPFGAGQGEFVQALYEKQLETMEALSGDVAWFCKKFDYRFKDADWKNSKDAPERAIAFLSGDGGK